MSAHQLNDNTFYPLSQFGKMKDFKQSTIQVPSPLLYPMKNGFTLTVNFIGGKR